MNTPLPEQDGLPRNKEETGLLAAVSNPTNTGKPRNILLPKTANAQELTNPLIITTERVLLAAYTSDNRSDNTNANSLAIKEDTTRHSFDDGYYLFEFQALWQNEEFALLVSKESWNESNTNSRINLPFSHAGNPTTIWRESATAFRIFSVNSEGAQLNQSATQFLKAIYGHKLTAKRTVED